MSSLTAESNPTSFTALIPKFQAVSHGCWSREYFEAFVFLQHQIDKGAGYGWKQFGALTATLGAVACFFEEPWGKPVRSLQDIIKGWLLNEAGLCLRALGRLTEALEPMRSALAITSSQNDWKNAAQDASNVAELLALIGRIEEAQKQAEQAVIFADRHGTVFARQAFRTTLGFVLHQSGKLASARRTFRKAEKIARADDAKCRFLYSLSGFLYCALFLAKAERVFWRKMLELDVGFFSLTWARVICDLVEVRAKEGRRLAEQQHWGLLTISNDCLTRGRAILIEERLIQRPPHLNQITIDRFTWAQNDIQSAVTGLRKAGRDDYLPSALMTRAILHIWANQGKPNVAAHSDLDEAWDIAERGPMRLHMADIHLYRARLFFREQVYP